MLATGGQSYKAGWKPPTGQERQQEGVLAPWTDRNQSFVSALCRKSVMSHEISDGSIRIIGDQHITDIRGIIIIITIIICS